MTNSVNSTKPVASTATKRWISRGSDAFSVTANARTNVSAPRRPPQAIASLYEASMRRIKPSRSSGGMSTNRTNMRAAAAAAINTTNRSTSRHPTSTSSRGTRIEAKTKSAQRQARRQRRDHAGYVEQALRSDERQIGKRQCQCGFGQPVIAKTPEDPEHEPAREESDHAAADEGYGKLAQPCYGVRFAPGLDHPEQHDEQGNRGRVVQERFALDQPRQSGRRADIAEDGDDRRRIRRGNDGAEEQANGERNASERPQRKADHRRRNDRGDDREDEYRGSVLDRPPDVRGNAGLEYEQRQKHVNEGARTDRQLGKERGGRVDRAPRAQLAQHGREQADSDADCGEQNGWRQPQADRERLAYPDDDQQPRNDEQHKSGIEHGVATA